MGNFFFDDSIHDRGAFVLGAFVFCEEDPKRRLATELTRLGFEPGRDEFKSGTFNATPERHSLREAFWEILYDSSRVGLVAAARSARDGLGHEALLGLRKILAANRFLGHGHVVHFDQGVLGGPQRGACVAAAVGLPGDLDLRFEQDSKVVLGLQLADLVAHSASTMLLAELGVAKKTVKAGADSGYDPESEMELEFEMFARLRYTFFRGPKLSPQESGKEEPYWADVRSYGLHIADSCPPALRDAADSCFGMVYLGCIH